MNYIPSTTSNKLLTYFEYYIPAKLKKSLIDEIKAELYEEVAFEFFVETTPYSDESKEALAIMKKANFQKKDVMYFLREKVYLQMQKEAQKLMTPAFTPLYTSFDNITIMINFDWTDPRGAWIITPKNTNDSMPEITKELRCLYSNSISDKFIRIPCDRQDALTNGIGFLEMFTSFTSCTDLYYESDKKRQKFELPSMDDDYTYALYRMAAQKEIDERREFNPFFPDFLF